MPKPMLLPAVVRAGVQETEQRGRVLGSLCQSFCWANLSLVGSPLNLRLHLHRAGLKSLMRFLLLLFSSLPGAEAPRVAAQSLAHGDMPELPVHSLPPTDGCGPGLIEPHHFLSGNPTLLGHMPQAPVT